MAQLKLTQTILENSVATTWDAARLEWVLTGIYDAEEPEECACGHSPITELCEIKNTKNGNVMIVGSKCVEKFMGLQSEKLFAAIKRVKNDTRLALNPDTIQLAYNKGLVTQWEHDFYIDTWRKRSLSDKQINRRILINEKILKDVTDLKT